MTLKIPDSLFISEKVFEEYEKKIAQATAATASLNKGVGDIPGLTGTTATENSLIETLTKGISPEKADVMLASDIVKNEEAVKKTLSSSGVSTIPPNVFDGLVSFQNEVGDISYAYIANEKIDLTGLYKTGEWDRAASFIAADERNRTRRIKEAAIIVSNSYGPEVNEDVLIQQGLTKTNGLIAKGKLNQQTGEPATDQQALAVATNYLNQTGKSVPTLSYPVRVLASNNKLEELVKQSAGPWPY
jgi:hypothetical protein